MTGAVGNALRRRLRVRFSRESRCENDARGEKGQLAEVDVGQTGLPSGGTPTRARDGFRDSKTFFCRLTIVGTAIKPAKPRFICANGQAMINLETAET